MNRYIVILILLGFFHPLLAVSQDFHIMIQDWINFMAPGSGPDINTMIQKWINFIKAPARLVLGLAFAATAFKWFRSGDEGRRATLAALIAIGIFFLGFEIVQWLATAAGIEDTRYNPY